MLRAGFVVKTLTFKALLAFVIVTASLNVDTPAIFNVCPCKVSM